MAMGQLGAEFARAHPEGRLEVTSDDQAVDMVEGGYDLVIRVNPAPDEAAVGRPFLHDRLVVGGPDMPQPVGATVLAVVRGADPVRRWTTVGLDGPVVIEVEPVLRLS